MTQHDFGFRLVTQSISDLRRLEFHWKTAMGFSGFSLRIISSFFLLNVVIVYSYTISIEEP